MCVGKQTCRLYSGKTEEPDRLHSGQDRSLTAYRSFFHDRSFLIVLGVDAGLFCDKHAHGTFQQPVVGIRWFQIMLDLTADLDDAVIQMFYDMEHINVDDRMGKDLPCNRDEAVVHVTAVEADFYLMITKAVMWRDCVKNFEEILIGQNVGFALGRIRIWETDGSIF